jgi:hypothetical protein
MLAIANVAGHATLAIANVAWPGTLAYGSFFFSSISYIIHI